MASKNEFSFLQSDQRKTAFPNIPKTFFNIIWLKLEDHKYIHWHYLIRIWKNHSRAILGASYFSTPSCWFMLFSAKTTRSISFFFRQKKQYLKNMKFFAIWVKALSKPGVSQRKSFCSFSFSWETNLWVTLGDFTVKKWNIMKENLNLSKNLNK